MVGIEHLEPCIGALVHVRVPGSVEDHRERALELASAGPISAVGVDFLPVLVDADNAAVAIVGEPVQARGVERAAMVIAGQVGVGFVRPADRPHTERRSS